MCRETAVAVITGGILPHPYAQHPSDPQNCQWWWRDPSQICRGICGNSKLTSGVWQLQTATIEAESP
jgi:hypothetical protein